MDIGEIMSCASTFLRTSIEANTKPRGAPTDELEYKHLVTNDLFIGQNTAVSDSKDHLGHRVPSALIG